MTSEEKWRRRADGLLAAAIRKKRSLNTITGKVDDRFQEILAARQRGMAWKDIAAAIEDGTTIKADAVESAFKRICEERNVNPPGKGARNSASRVTCSNTKTIDKPSLSTLEVNKGAAVDNDDSAPNAGENSKGADLFGSRWVDDGE
ncbi:hypothetical protein M8312_13125 [Sphingomonas sp. KRR8]|uniref:hypothetical protein n=1 Tax=Sphingomonas sp. KRR8 TaxID=2942996 RepID=UPI0020208C06|nr:hypothetical protein [Sphingomonas sp. KRR8]URD60701.1 hypothetical protein M8312_13125 [Sphingomonas sp. KRR8]